MKQQASSTATSDPGTTLEMVNLKEDSVTVVGTVAENPPQSLFGNSRIHVPPRQIAVDRDGTAYLITLSGMTMLPLTPAGSSRSQIGAGIAGIINVTDGTRNFRPGSFVLINGANLASASVPDQLPPPTVAGGSCVTFSSLQLPILRTSTTQILAQVPETVSPGTLEIVDLDTAAVVKRVSLPAAPEGVAVGGDGRVLITHGSVLYSAFNIAPVQNPSATATTRPVAAVAAAGSGMIARFSQPVRTSATAAVTDTPAVELVDVTTGMPRGSSAVLEGPLASQVGNQRVNVSGRTMAVNSSETTAYIPTTSGLSIVPLSSTTQVQPGALSSNLILLNQNGVVNTARYQTKIAPGSVVSMFGQNLASEAIAQSLPLPTVLGGVCVTLDDSPVLLLMTSSGQINLQVPPSTKIGTHTLVVKSPERRLASGRYTLTVQKYAPAVVINTGTGQVAVYRANGTPVSTAAPAKRDEPLVMYATGLGAMHGGVVTAGQAAPSSPPAESDKVQVFFGDPKIKQSEVIVD